MALAAGVPAVHIAYDRKGPATFADLGLEDWCLDVRSLDHDSLRAVVDDLAADATGYWDRFAARTGALAESSRRLDALVRATVRP
jgi:polysaccharide pyruvyl transferase WcaK-like protein